MTANITTFKYIKLTTGQEMIAEVISDNFNYLEISSDAFLIFLQESQNPLYGPPTLGFIPFAPFTSDKTIHVPKAHIIFSTTPNDELLGFYKQASGRSKIQPVHAGIIKP